MKKIALFIGLALIGSKLQSCTLFWADSNDQILCAKNMDWMNRDARMLFIPASEGKYGRVYFGVASEYGFTNTSGMNEMGLWYGGASLPPRNDVYNTYHKPTWNYELIEKVMEECVTVQEAISIFTEYWEPHWDGHSLLADKYGNCVVIAYGEDDVEFFESQNNYQVITNFYLSDTVNARWYSCRRFEMANMMLDTCHEISFSLFRDVANRTHAEGLSHPTVLTNIHELKSGDIQLVSMHNFIEYLEINLFEELSKGHHYLACADYFSKINMLSPEHGSSVLSKEIKFVWTGESAEYEIRYSKDPHFNEYEKVLYSISTDQAGLVQGKWYFYFLFISLLLLFRKRKSTAVLCIFFIFAQSCEKMELQPQYSKKRRQVHISGLEANSSYYWKVVSTKDEYASESVAWRFDT